MIKGSVKGRNGQVGGDGFDRRRVSIQARYNAAMDDQGTTNDVSRRGLVGSGDYGHYCYNRGYQHQSDPRRYQREGKGGDGVWRGSGSERALVERSLLTSTRSAQLRSLSNQPLGPNPFHP